ncbi:helix-turn-helix domain-containing protein [Microbacterium sp. 18062]|uniref:helix-turn-helix domain-containing protein n=1 Tax=Microbacterium sp. 18062 TaxID=2681410 RepID=UPI0013587B63|nr:helix-turn-helix domain-containing protein [Microbacterium sp. 18062]
MPDDLGTRLRQARVTRGLSLRSVAQELGVSASLISQVEIGKTQPSVSTLFALATHLGVSLDEMLGIENAHSPRAPIFGHAGPALPDVQAAADNPVIEMENGVRWERLAAGAGGPADALLVTYEPGASSSVEGKMMRHAGFEYAYIIEGELTLHLEFDTHLLRSGDSVQFDSVRPHMFANPGEVPAKGVWFVVGRRQPLAPGKAMPVHSTEPERTGPPLSAVDVLRALESL